MSDILYLASQSASRQSLLRRCRIPFEILRHDSDECGVDPELSFEDYVLEIARQKMNCVVLPDSASIKSDEIFVLTADTLVKTTKSGQILCKPEDKKDAKRILTVMQKELIFITTGFVLDKKGFVDFSWKTLDKREVCVSTEAEYCVPDDMMDYYIDNVPGVLTASGAATVEGFGDNFFKSINGSYSGVIGIPIHELRQALKELGFRF